MTDLTVRGQYEQAQRDVAQRQIPRALARCQRVLTTYPRHLGTYGVLGQIYLELGRYEDAANLLRRLLGADPENVIGYVGLGAIYEARGLLDEAIWQFERAVELSPRNPQVRAELSRLHRQRTPEGAGRIAMSRGALARVYMRAQLFPKAIGELRELVAEEPHRFDLRVALAEALWHDRRLADAEAVCQGILAELPHCLKANLILGRLWLQTDQDDQARALLQRAQALDPENAVAQAIFGDDSPLPVRVARLPLTEEEEEEPIYRYYVVDDDEVVASAPIIEGDKIHRAPRVIDWQALDDRTLDMLGFVAQPSAPPVAIEGPGQDEPLSAPTPSMEEADGSLNAAAEAEPPFVNKQTLLDLQRGRVAENPEDHVERLRLARLYSALGEWDDALPHYERLAREGRGLPAVRRDLDVWHLLCPDHASLTTLWLNVRYGRIGSA
jgi:tetratricopeptide (TPR) repeat protein